MATKHPAWKAAQEFVTPPAATSPAAAPVAAAPVAASPPPAAPVVAASPPLAVAPTTAPVPTPADFQRERDKWLLAQEEAENQRIQERAEARRRQAEIEEAGAATARNLTEQLNAMRADIEARDQKLLEIDTDRLLTLEGINIEHLDADAARELTQKVLKPIVNGMNQRNNAELTKLRKELQASQLNSAASVTEVSERLGKTLRRQVNERILAAHPTFIEDSSTREYKEFLSRTIPGSRRTFEQEMTEAYNEGDADYVINAVKVWKAGNPRLSDVADVPSRGGNPDTATLSNVPVNETTYKYTDLGDWLAELRSGKIKQPEYQARKADFLKAEKEGRVK